MTWQARREFESPEAARRLANLRQKSAGGFEGDRYRYVRNPMAVAGIVQGIAVGWYLGSYAVIVYSLVGAVLWHVAVCPVEEADLNSRFGKTYNEYQQRVRLWRTYAGLKRTIKS